jgi:hypothetical protein
MLQHLNEADNGDDFAAAAADTLPSGDGGERQRRAALRRDYIAWLANTRTHELPERAFSAGMDLPVLGQGTYLWLAHLTPAQRQKAMASMTAFREYTRLNQKKRVTLVAWLARDDQRGVRKVLYELLRKGYNAVEALRKRGDRARKALRASEPPLKAPATPATAKTPPPPPPKKRPEERWPQFLDKDEQKRVEELRPSYNKYRNLERSPAERNAWLAADDE